MWFGRTTRETVQLSTFEVFEVRSVFEVFVFWNTSYICEKVYLDYYPEAYDHLEDWYFSKVERELVTGVYYKSNINTNVYANQTCSIMHF